MKIIEIDGNNFNDLGSFYDEIESKFTHNLNWKIGRNLDAFNDVMRGGFGITEYEEPVTVVWKNADKSRADLGWDATILSFGDPKNASRLQRLEAAQKHEGPTLFEDITEIISSHSHIKLKLE